MTQSLTPVQYDRLPLILLHDKKSGIMHTFVHKEAHPMVKVHFLLVRDKIHIKVEATVCIPALSM